MCACQVTLHCVTSNFNFLCQMTLRFCQTPLLCDPPAVPAQLSHWNEWVGSTFSTQCKCQSEHGLCWVFCACPVMDAIWRLHGPSFSCCDWRARLSPSLQQYTSSWLLVVPPLIGSSLKILDSLLECVPVALPDRQHDLVLSRRLSPSFHRLIQDITYYSWRITWPFSPGQH